MKTWIIIAIIIATIGLALMVIGAVDSGGQFLHAIGEDTTTRTVDLSEPVTGVTIKVIDASITIRRSQEAKLELAERPKRGFKVTLKDGALTIEQEKVPWWNNIFNIPFGATNIILDLPEALAKDVEVRTVNGEVDIAGLDCPGLQIEAVNGKITVADVKANTVEIEAVNGRIKVTGTQVEESLIAETANGMISVNLQGRPTDFNISTKTLNGKVNIPEGSNTAPKRLRLETLNGRIEGTFYE